MTVWVISHGFNYEGEQAVSVHATEASALAVLDGYGGARRPRIAGGWVVDLDANNEPHVDYATATPFEVKP